MQRAPSETFSHAASKKQNGQKEWLTIICIVLSLHLCLLGFGYKYEMPKPQTVFKPKLLVQTVSLAQPRSANVIEPFISKPAEEIATLTPKEIPPQVVPLPPPPVIQEPTIPPPEKKPETTVEKPIKPAPAPVKEKPAAPKKPVPPKPQAHIEKKKAPQTSPAPVKKVAPPPKEKPVDLKKEEEAKKKKEAERIKNEQITKENEKQRIEMEKKEKELNDKLASLNQFKERKTAAPQKKQSDNLSLPIAETPLTIDQFPMIAIGDIKGLDSNEISYKDKMQQLLKRALTLPEYGAVEIKLTLNKSGKVVKIETTASKSQRNTQYIERTLPTLTFPPFNALFGPSQEYTFTITLNSQS